MNDAKEILKAAVSSGYRYVTLLGGEVFLYYNELVELIAYCSDIGLKSSIDTNGFWGRTTGDARAKLKELAECGLENISVSIDTYHTKFIPAKYSLNVICAARDLGLSNGVIFCVSSDKEKDNILLNKLRKETDNVFVNDIEYTGRASHCLDEKEDAISVETAIPCDMLGVHIMPNGDTTVCCSVSDDNRNIMDTPLYMGNCIQDDPNKILGKQNIFRMEDFFHNPDSPVWFKSFLKQEKFKSLWKGKKYTCICELCREMMHIREISDSIMEIASCDKEEKR